jgi:hypothetical protein
MCKVNWAHLHVLLAIQALQLRDGVGKQRQVRNFGQRLQAFNHFNPVERQIQPLQVDEGFQASNPGNFVVVKAQLAQPIQSVQVFDSRDAHVGQGELWQLGQLQLQRRLLCSRNHT